MILEFLCKELNFLYGQLKAVCNAINHNRVSCLLRI